MTAVSLSTEGIRSRLEWNTTLNPASAPLPTEDTKYYRKVCVPLLSTRAICS